MQGIFVSDLHGINERYKTLFSIIKKEHPDAVFFGGDLLPNHHAFEHSMDVFLRKYLFLPIQHLRKQLQNPLRFFVILGNDDPRVYESLFVAENTKGTIDYVHNRTVAWGDFFVSGYGCVPPTPFLLKDWEKYDVSRFVDVGAVSPEEGIRSVPLSLDEITQTTIADDIKKLSKNSPVRKTIFLFHSPPYDSALDVADIQGNMIDYAPVDIHIGSISIQRFIVEKQPFLTLHGHAHESVRLTGKWKEQKEKTFSFTAAHDGPELAVVRFDTDHLKRATRELL